VTIQKIKDNNNPQTTLRQFALDLNKIAIKHTEPHIARKKPIPSAINTDRRLMIHYGVLS